MRGDPAGWRRHAAAERWRPRIRRAGFGLLLAIEVAALVFIAALILRACDAQAGDNPATALPPSAWDATGNRYPIECQRDLAGVNALVVRTRSADHIKALWWRLIGSEPPARLYGFALPRTLPLPTVFVDGSMKPAMIEATIHHEKCHVLWMHLTGSPHWHVAYRGYHAR